MHTMHLSWNSVNSVCYVCKRVENHFRDKWRSLFPRRLPADALLGRHMFSLVSVVLMGYVRLSALPCPASLGTDSIHLLNRQLELETKPGASC